MKSVPAHLYFDVVADLMIDICNLCNLSMSYQLANKYRHIIDRDNMADVTPEDCARNVRAEWLKPKKIEYISPLNKTICLGVHKF